MMPAGNYGNEASDWFWTATKYWPSAKTAMYYVGLGGGSITGGRFLAPGQAENEGTYTLGSAHKNLEDVDAVYSYLEEQKYITTEKDEDGDIVRVLIGSYTDKATGLTYSAYAVPTDARKAEETTIQAVVDYFVEGVSLLNHEDSPKYFNVDVVSTSLVAEETPLTYFLDEETEVVAGDVVIVSQDKKGNYSLEGVAKTSNKASKVKGETFATGKLADAELTSTDTYWLDNVTFKKNEITYLTDATENAYNKSYVYTATASDIVNAIVYTDDKAVDHVIEVTDADLYYVNDEGKYASTKTLDAKKDITVADLANGIKYGDQVLTDFNTLTDAEFEIVLDGKGYEETTATSRKYVFWTVNGEDLHAENDSVEIFGTVAGTYNKITSYGSADRITFVEVERDFEFEEYFDENGIAIADTKYSDCTRIGSEVVKVSDGTAVAGVYTYDWDEMSFGFETEETPIETDEELDAKLFAVEANTAGLYYIVSPENDSDYYVLLLDYADNKSGIDLGNDWSYSAKNMEGYYELSVDETLTTKLVELDGEYYPAFETEEDLIEFVTKVAGIAMLEGSSAKADAKTDFYKWYQAASAEVEAEIVTLSEPLPTSATTNLHGASECEYSVSSEAEDAKVTIEATNTVDTNVAGVYDLEYAAKYDGEVVGTTSIKVVVAPNYTRTWENGRVKTLTSYYVSHPTAKYAEYNYNWSAGTVTVTYYNVDGSVNETATNNL